MSRELINEENLINLENANNINSFGISLEESLQPALNAFRIKLMNENMDKAKGEIKNLINAENDVEFARKLKIAIQKYYDSGKETLSFPSEVMQMIQEAVQNPEMTSMAGILEEIGIQSGQAVYTKQQREAFAENTTHVMQRLNKKIEHTIQKTQEINQMNMELIQLLRACLKKEDDAKMSPTRGVRGVH